MPRLSQVMIRAALIWLGIGFTTGALVLLNKGVPLLPWLWSLRMAHIHMLLVGWVAQLACGVAFWVLPRLDPDGSRGNERPAWLACVALNSGVALAMLLDPLVAAGLLSAPGLPGVLAGGLYAIAAIAFVVHAWPRVLPFRSFPRA